MEYLYTNKFLIAAAVIPALFLAVKVYRADKFDREPPGLLLSLIFFGVVSTGFALITEKLGMAILADYYEVNSAEYKVLFYFVVVAISEEGFKYLLLKLRTWRSPAFDSQFDGVVYAVFVSLGFALWENISYVVKDGFGTAMVRAFTAVPGHACFGVFMGVWYGLAKKYSNFGHPAKSRACRWLSFVLPAFIHSSYDFILSMEETEYFGLFVAFIIIMFVVAWRLVKSNSKNDERIV